jgi:cyclohexa-1,5-dienecarbonyl-CoA hydratase
MKGAIATASGLRVEELEGGTLWSVTLATPRANILDAAKVSALRAVFECAQGEQRLKAILLAGEGAHFSFGASVEEHLPGEVERMLAGFHGLLLALLECDVACLAAVRGQCLGGALELVQLCQRVFAAPDARLGQPEITLGVFAPAASLALVERIGRGAAEDLLLSGRSVGAPEALALGLVDQLADDPRAAALEYARTQLLPKSAASLRLALHAARSSFRARFRSELAGIERLYLEQLMKTHDAVEGLRAFLEKRAPRWSDA